MYGSYVVLLVVNVGFNQHVPQNKIYEQIINVLNVTELMRITKRIYLLLKHIFSLALNLDCALSIFVHQYQRSTLHCPAKSLCPTQLL